MQETKKKNKKPLPSAGWSAGESSLLAAAAGKVENNNDAAIQNENNSESAATKANSTTKNARKPNRKKPNNNSATQMPRSPTGNESNVHSSKLGSTHIIPGPTKSLQTNGNDTAPPANATMTAQQRSKPTKKTNKSSEMLQSMSNTSVNKKLDDVLQTVRQLDNTCDFARCKVKTSLIFQDCKLCDQRFCMKHQLPEVHGCGGAARKTERSEFLKPRTIPISAALRRNEQKDAHARLEQKLKDMSLARQKVRK